MDHLNFLAIGVAALASFMLGALWYSPVLFAKTWQKELGFTDEYLKQGNMAVLFGTSFLLMLIMAFGLAVFFHDRVAGWQEGLHGGLLAGVLLVATSIGINYLYQRKSFKLWLIDAGYQVLFMALMGAILGAWA